LAAKLAARGSTADESKGRVQELKDLLGQRTAELKSAQAELSRQIEQRDRLESERKKHLDQVKAQAKEFEAAWTGAVDRNMHFEEMLSGLRAERDDLVRKLKTERQATAQAKQQFDELQAHLREDAADTTDLKAELDKRCIEHARVEAELNRRLEKATSLTKKLEAAWAEVVQRNRRLEAEIETIRRQHDVPSTVRRTEPALEKPPAGTQVRPGRTPSGRELSSPAPEKASRVERNSTAPNGKIIPSPKVVSGQKANGHHPPESRKPVNGDLSAPPRPGLGLYDLKP